MTKEELKKLVADKIAGQGTQVDLGNALPIILNELIDGMGGESSTGTTIDLRGFELGNDGIDVRSAIPFDWEPSANDVVLYDVWKYGSCGWRRGEDADVEAEFGTSTAYERIVIWFDNDAFTYMARLLH